MAYSQLRQYRNDMSIREWWGSAPPSTSADIGPYNLGDVMWNTVPAGGGATYIGWVCTTAGANGGTAVFKGFGLIQA